MKRYLLTAVLLYFTWSLFSQTSYGVSAENYVFDEAIKSVKITKNGADFGLPIIKLNSSEKLKLVFDDLNQEDRYLKYTLIHCSHDWNFSPLNPIEYIDGFLEDQITDYSYSFNTIQHYTHYQLIFPTDMMRLTKSGNYLLFVYDDTPDKPILTRRIMIEEPSSAAISGTVNPASDVNFREKKQQVDFTLFSGNYAVRNPALYLHASIIQNGRWDNAIMGLTYRSLKPGEFSFVYENMNKTLFTGGSEFRTFDTRTLRTLADRIVSINFEDKINQAYVMEDIARPYGAYETNTTLKGACYWLNDDYEGENNEDYVLTHFSLRCDFKVTGGDLYVFGELTDWRIIPDALLEFNKESNYWETSLFLKQGFYNYQYVYVPKGTKIIDETYIEGSHWQTSNGYTILMYLQEEGTSYDKLIGSYNLTIKK